MVNISETNASIIIDILSTRLNAQAFTIEKLKKSVDAKNKTELDSPLRRRKEVISEVLMALVDSGYFMDEYAAKRFGFDSVRTSVAYLINYASTPVEMIPVEYREPLAQLEAETGIKICG